MSELQRIPLDYLEKIGRVTDSKPVETRPFESAEPFALVEKDFSEDECECGGEYDEYDRCSSCSNGHDDCSTQDCFACLERAISRAEDAFDGDR